MKHALAAALAVCPLFAAPVTITGEVRRPDGTLVTGIATIDLSAPCIVSGSLILDRTKTVGFSNGAFSVQLEPTTGCPDLTYYRVRYRIDRVWSQSYEYWSVPPSPTSTTIGAVRQFVEPGGGTGGGGGTQQWTSTVLNFGTILDYSCAADQTFNATGLQTGTALLVVPYSSMPSVSVFAWGSATNTARVRVCNGGPGDQTVSGVFTVKQVASGYLQGSAALSFPIIIAGDTSAAQTITVAGATTSMGVVLGLPATLPAGLRPTARVTSANTVSVWLTNLTDTDAPAFSGTFTGVLIQ